MGVLAARSQELAARDDDGGQGGWGPMQIATPAIVGGVLILLFVAYILWQRRQSTGSKRTYDYHQVKNGWTARIEQIFVPRRIRHKVLHCSAPVILDDSMRSAGLTIDFRRARQHHSDSLDSQTPLTSTTYGFGYPPRPMLSESPLPTLPKRHAWRWWQVVETGPQEIRSQEPSSRWHVDDVSSSGHGSHCHERVPGYVSGLEAVDEGQEEVEVQDNVILIGDNFTNLSTPTPTPMIQQFPERERMVPVFSPVPEFSGSSGGRTPAVPISNSQSARASPAPSRNRDLPPGYNATQSHTRYPSVEDLARPPRAEPYMVFPPPVRAAGYGTPHMLHGQQLSSDSFLASHSPMATPSMY